jgi:F-type H+-transporting ATPase subunit delta
MTDVGVVRRYAKALFASAQKLGEMDQVENDLGAIDQALRSVPRLDRALRAPTISASRKRQLLSNAFGSRVTPLTQRFLNLVVERRREEILTVIFREYQRLANEARNLLPVHVTSAVPLSDEERARLAAALAQRTGKKAIVQVSVDPKILGGVVLRMGDIVIDDSVRTRLAHLKARLNAQMGTWEGRPEY